MDKFRELDGPGVGEQGQNEAGEVDMMLGPRALEFFVGDSTTDSWVKQKCFNPSHTATGWWLQGLVDKVYPERSGSDGLSSGTCASGYFG